MGYKSQVFSDYLLCHQRLVTHFPCISVASVFIKPVFMEQMRSTMWHKK